MPLAHDNLEEFQDPANYDREEIPRSLVRIAFYVDLACRVGGPALELACGSGIVALPVARAGVHVTGVDLAAPMLQHARAKAVAERLDGMTQWLHGDAKQMRIEGGPRSRFVFIAGNAFQAFPTAADHQALLANAQHHLRPGGVFAFETRNPSGHDLADINEEEPWAAFTSVQGHAVTVTGLQRYDATTQLMHWTTFRRWHDGALHDDAHRLPLHAAGRARCPDRALRLRGGASLRRLGPLAVHRAQRTHHLRVRIRPSAVIRRVRRRA